MAWNKQTFSVCVKRGEFFAHRDGTEGELSRGDTDGELYIRIWFPANEHGKASMPVSMQLKNWKRLVDNADHIDVMVEKATASREAIRQIEAEKAAYTADITKLNDGRKAFPDVFTDDVYGLKAMEIQAKYPKLFPVNVTEEQEA